MGRSASIHRVTKETDISLSLTLDGSGTTKINTGIGFFDHMLNSFARHGFFDVTLLAKGDLEVDTHHTVEDTGIVLGTAIKEALGDKASIKRYGSAILPMDETLVLCAIDLSGRPCFCFDAELKAERVGDFETEMVKEFFCALSCNSGMNLHVKKISGENTHHAIEGIFKAFAKALDEATLPEPRIRGVLSTKGKL